MKRTVLILIITLVFSFFAVAQETGAKMEGAGQWQKTMGEYNIPSIPALFVNKINSHWVGVGFMVNNPESFGKDTPISTFMSKLPAFQAGLFMQGKYSSSSVVVSYGHNNIWGISAKFRF